MDRVMPAQQGLAAVDGAGDAVADGLVADLELIHRGGNQGHAQVVLETLVMTLVFEHGRLEHVPGRPGALVQVQHCDMQGALELVETGAMLGIQRPAEAEPHDQGLATQLVRLRQRIENLGRHVARRARVQIGRPHHERVRRMARHLEIIGLHLQALRNHGQQQLVVFEAEHGAQLGMVHHFYQEHRPAIYTLALAEHQRMHAAAQFAHGQRIGQRIACHLAAQQISFDTEENSNRRQRHARQQPLPHQVIQAH